MAKVLVADDERDIREMLVDTLVDAGYDVLEAAYGELALDLARRESPDLVLLDVWMPVMDGLEVLRRLRESPDMEGLPVILLTAMSAIEGEPAGLKLGVQHYITKPFDPDWVLCWRFGLRSARQEGRPTARRMTIQ